ncbi:deoxynucleoside kinase [Bacteroidales bacterium OttesenSCG-928-B11]|nr:deoxynucleoside kinase [Bacteroidales bacterium OttesenSCG-928-C03]MDL2311872.1 deoxynucleoside kinase [Bacteroidales bacterium OttesenSCG-928-B11]MDL2326171.1 deoxynucleoside kinase [Bacteroidales bacterium OttesenSCG-928-A14]
MHIAVAGNIGSGKTTLTGMLAKQFGWEPSYETVEGNPYLVSFYEDMQRWSFNLQVYFLNKRFRQVLDIRKKKKDTIQDRTIYEDAYIFAANLHDMGLMATRDFENYTSLFELMQQFLQYPDLLIYLRADTSTLVAQIAKRGREYENTIRLDYLTHLNEKYEKWIASYEEEVVKAGKGKLLIVDVNTNKFEDSAEDFGEILNKINSDLFGLF